MIKKEIIERRKRTINPGFLDRPLSHEWINSSANLNNYCTWNWPSGPGQNSYVMYYPAAKVTLFPCLDIHVFATEFMSFADKVVHLCMFASKLSYQSKIWQLRSDSVWLMSLRRSWYQIQRDCRRMTSINPKCTWIMVIYSLITHSLL